MPSTRQIKLNIKPKMQRPVPVIKDLKAQLKVRPNSTHVFMYDDGGIYRAFSVESFAIYRDNGTVEGHYNGDVVVTIPIDTTWRYVSLDSLDLVTGAEIMAGELMNQHLEYKLYKETVKALGIKPEDNGSGAQAMPELVMPQSLLDINNKKIHGTGTGGQYL